MSHDDETMRWELVSVGDENKVAKPHRRFERLSERRPRHAEEMMRILAREVVNLIAEGTGVGDAKSRVDCRAAGWMEAWTRGGVAVENKGGKRDVQRISWG